MPAMTQYNPAPTGIVARFFGSSGGATTYVYFIQAIYATGRSGIALSNTVTALAAFDHNNQMLVQWNPMAGAIGYNVFRGSSTTKPTSGTIFLGTVSQASYVDNGVALSTGLVTLDGFQLFRGRYNFAVDGGGAPGLITVSLSDTIPLGAILVGGAVKVITNLASATNISIGTSAGSSASSLLASTAIATVNTGTVGGVTALVPTFATPVNMSADGTVTITSTVAALTAGVLDIMVLAFFPIG